MPAHLNTAGRLSVGVAVLLLASSGPARAASCESLTSLTLAQGSVTMARPVAAGAFTPPAGGRGGGSDFRDLPAFCRVTATLKPSSDSDIAIEVWLPASGWNGKLQAVGNGGWSGSINQNALADGLRRGYATAATDTGHQGGGGPWMQSRDKLIDFGYRAVHEMAVNAKAIINAYYGMEARLSYFNGCSAGGRQALKAAQRYPADFDGVVAGAPAVNTTGRAAFSMWVAQQLRREKGSYIPASKYPAIHDAALKACDASDGVTDQLIGNPQACRFDPQVLQCTAGDNDSCLTAPQVAAARAIYSPLVSPRTKKEIFPGLSPGSEPGWSTFGAERPFVIGVQMYQHMVFKDPSWNDLQSLDFDRDWARVEQIENGAINALDPNLRPYFARGGRIIQYHGWADPQISAQSSVEYYESVLSTLGGPGNVTNNYRLFMVPGMAHCGGGTGTSTFDMLTALERWVEQGQAPNQIRAAQVVDGRTLRTRPLCPYPQIATYSGSGSIDDAGSFACRPPASGSSDRTGSAAKQ